MMTCFVSKFPGTLHLGVPTLFFDPGAFGDWWDTLHQQRSESLGRLRCWSTSNMGKFLKWGAKLIQVIGLKYTFLLLYIYMMICVCVRVGICTIHHIGIHAICLCTWLTHYLSIIIGLTIECVNVWWCLIQKNAVGLTIKNRGFIV